MLSHPIMNKVVSGAQKFHRYNKTTIDSRITVYISSYLNIYPVIFKARLRVSKTRRFYFIWQFCFPLLLNKYISNISNIYNPDKNSSLASQKICEHIFSDLKSNHTLHIFWLITCLIYIFFSYVVIVHLLRRWEGVWIYCKLIPNWIESTP